MPKKPIYLTQSINSLRMMVMFLYLTDDRSKKMDNNDSIEMEFEAALLAMDWLSATRLLVDSEGGSPVQRIERLVVPALERIGRDWEQGRIALSQVYMSGRICEQLVDNLLSENSASRQSQPKMALATLGDYHLLGKRMVYATLRASGYEVQDYGRMDAATLVRQACEEGIEVLLISTLMLSSALQVAKVRDGLDLSGRAVKIVVGGAPFRFDERLWREVGSTAMGMSASDVTGIVAGMTGGQS
jgi:methanogenic corrinoid protein MtbC1